MPAAYHTPKSVRDAAAADPAAVVDDPNGDDLVLFSEDEEDLHDPAARGDELELAAGLVNVLAQRR